nr:MAG TPA: hypothetical protein [Caudoviricetes sp.]
MEVVAVSIEVKFLVVRVLNYQSIHYICSV